MYENVIIYKPEYARNERGIPQRYKVNQDGVFMLKDGGLAINPNLTVKNHDQYVGKTDPSDFDLSTAKLIEDEDGEYYRNWRPEIKSTDDIWEEIVKVSKLPGVTSAPKLQPIETRLVMLQTGMRAPMA
jgi:copper/silver efflux system protein